MSRAREYPTEWLRLTTRWDDELYDPSEVKLQEALIELADPDVDNEALPSWEREASLAWRDGTHIWFIAAFTDGSVVFG